MKTRTVVLFGAWVVFATFAHTAFAAETGSAKGKVVDLATNAGVEGVKVVATTGVEFEEDKPYATVTTTTAKDGTYILTNLLATIPLQVRHVYTLSFEKAGYIVGRGYASDLVAGKTKIVGDIALCPIPTTHGVYRITNEDVQFLQRFMRDPSVRPAHPLTYEPLPQATYTKTPVPGKEGEFTRELTVSRETVIPQIVHRAKDTPGDPIMVIFDTREPALRLLAEEGSESTSRRFTTGVEGWVLQGMLELPLVNARCFVFYSGTSLFRGIGYCGLGSGLYAIFLTIGERVLTFLFEVVDMATGDAVTQCRNTLTIMRYEIATFRQQNGRWPTLEEFEALHGERSPESFHNPLRGVRGKRGDVWSRDADALERKKGDTYVDPEWRVSWLYSPSTGEVWPATSSGNGEASW